MNIQMNAGRTKSRAFTLELTNPFDYWRFGD